MNWNDRESIINLCKTSTSKAEVLRKMGKSDKSSRNRQLLQNLMDECGIEKFTHTTPINVDYSTMLPEILPLCECWSDVVRRLGLNPRGSNIATVQKWVSVLELNTSHFNSNRAKARGNVLLSIDDMCIIDSTVSMHVLKKKLIDGNIIPYVCQLCGISDNWNGKPLILQLDHVNGNPTDNRLINLRFLCPNCHTQTVTWGRKKRA